VKELAELGIEIVGFAADVHDRSALHSAIEKIIKHFGPIHVLEYSPMLDDYSLVDVMKLNVENAQYQLGMQLHGTITAVQTVVNDMVKQPQPQSGQNSRCQRTFRRFSTNSSVS
jgi:NADP-dependent 3-hydroxy acid dehydrogenase YdfG